MASVDFLSFYADALTTTTNSDGTRCTLTFSNVRCSDVSDLCKALAVCLKRPLTVTYNGKTEMWSYPLVQATIGIVTSTTIDVLVVTAVLLPPAELPDIPETK